MPRRPDAARKRTCATSREQSAADLRLSLAGDHMTGDLVCRLAIRLAGRIVPTHLRDHWHARWASCLGSLRVLVGRGEFPREPASELSWICGAAFRDALRTRSLTFDLEQWLRAPSPLLAVLALCTRGFAITRYLIGAGGGRMLPYAIVVVFALVVSLTIAFRCRSPLRGHDWRYWSLLLAKTGALVATLSLTWIEGGFALRRCLANETVRALGGGFLLMLGYFAAVGSAVLWSLGDQQRRCPVCLRRMISPVRIGSWASVFEPVTTELLCDQGHGAMCVQECEMGEPDRWLAIETLPS